jgi:hypothetical protein
MPEKEVIVEIGAEGGSITLLGIRRQRGWLRRQRGWLYSISVDEWLLDEERIDAIAGRDAKVQANRTLARLGALFRWAIEKVRYDSNAVDTWESALVLLDRYPWHMLWPIKVHSEFRQQIWVAVQRRFESESRPGPMARIAIGKWRQLCGGTNDPS